MCCGNGKVGLCGNWGIYANVCRLNIGGCGRPCLHKLSLFELFSVFENGKSFDGLTATCAVVSSSNHFEMLGVHY